MKNYVAPGIPSAEFLIPSGMSLSVNTVESSRGKISGITGSIDWFKYSDIHWLAREVGYHILWDWFDEWNDREERVRLDELKEKLLSWSQSKSIISDSLELIDFMRSLVIKYGKKFYAKMFSFDAGEPEEDNGNNRMFQSSRLGECVLLWVRLGIDSAIIESWKQKLKEDDLSYIWENIFPEDRKY